METLHVFSGEIMLITIVVLFWKVTLRKERCLGCASCELACPTGAIQYLDTAGFRSFTYQNRLCIACGACVSTCQEDAAELRHDLDLTKIPRMFSSEEIAHIALRVCERCKSFYAPEPQIKKVFNGPLPDYGALCPKCRMLGYKEKLLPRSRRTWPLRREKDRKEV